MTTGKLVPILLAVVMTATANADPAFEQCVAPEPSPDAPEQLSQFDFLIGDFAVSMHAWTGTAWSPARPVDARWQGWYGLRGQAIYDEWFDPAPGGDPSKPNTGVNVRYFDDEENIWKMMWIATSSRQVQDLRAEVQNGVLTMWQVHPPRPGWKAQFEREDENHWARISYVQAENGEWREEFKLAARRLACASD